ncbi:hypothetical protein KIN20_000318 [Parelaphostrongylus tenuis]|uniref:Uncharacterized protein n=1 Tax=Parelaphostrongylus tenuis TaxID=148309 RepID=A0AAD5LS07_PARTN|nr:hypothetical protein KIN20_000318 [Parelaphostrongylus tenuis]
MQMQPAPLPRKRLRDTTYLSILVLKEVIAKMSLEFSPANTFLYSVADISRTIQVFDLKNVIEEPDDYQYPLARMECNAKIRIFVCYMTTNEDSSNFAEQQLFIRVFAIILKLKALASALHGRFLKEPFYNTVAFGMLSRQFLVLHPNHICSGNFNDTICDKGFSIEGGSRSVKKGHSDSNDEKQKGKCPRYQEKFPGRLRFNMAPLCCEHGAAISLVPKPVASAIARYPVTTKSGTKYLATVASYQCYDFSRIPKTIEWRAKIRPQSEAESAFHPYRGCVRPTTPQRYIRATTHSTTSLC